MPSSIVNLRFKMLAVFLLVLDSSNLDSLFVMELLFDRHHVKIGFSYAHFLEVLAAQVVLLRCLAACHSYSEECFDLYRPVV